MMDKTFMELEETKDALEIFCRVVHSKEFIKVQYKHEGTPYYLEFPKTEWNEDLKEGDEVEMGLLIYKEQE